MADAMDQYVSEQAGGITDALESLRIDSGVGDAPPVEGAQGGDVVESQEPEPANGGVPAVLPSESISNPFVDPTPDTATPPIEIQQTPNGSWRRRGERVTDLDLRRDGEPHTPEPDKTGSGSASNGDGSGGEGGQEGPMTPMNDAGPFVFDGGAMDDVAAAVSPTTANPPTPPDDINNSDWRSAVPN